MGKGSRRQARVLVTSVKKVRALVTARNGVLRARIRGPRNEGCPEDVKVFSNSKTLVGTS